LRTCVCRFLVKLAKSAGLPKHMLKWPIFDPGTPTIHVKFLGNVVVHKNQQYIKMKLHPQEEALLIQIALKASEPNKSIPLADIYQSFFPKDRSPYRLLSNLVVLIKKKLLIPRHLFGLKEKIPHPALINRGVHLTTDYQEFEQMLAQAKALENAGEWNYARKEYLRAFKLFRGAPFKKMYDPWSEQMRRVILNKLETEATHFAGSCLEHKNKKDARKVLEKVLNPVRKNALEIKSSMPPDLLSLVNKHDSSF